MELTRGWSLLGTAAGGWAAPDDHLHALPGWAPVTIPCTVAGVLPHEADLDDRDWWFRRDLRMPSEGSHRDLVLELDGVATEFEVFLDRDLVLRGHSMWRSHAIPVETPTGDHELHVVCRALAPLLARRRRPRARWRSRVVDDGNLRWHRTMIFGRSPGFAPGPPAVGPWRPIRLVPRARHALARDLRVSARLDGTTGVIVARAPWTGDDDAPDWTLEALGQEARPRVRDGEALAEIRVADVEPWWPHTHGTPHLHEVRIRAAGEEIRRRVGFRQLEVPADIAADGFSARVNGVDVFLRGVVWTPLDLAGLDPDPDHVRTVLQRLRDAGMNLIRIPGTGHYESPVFHDLCDELGILVWQDLMFAVLDYPLEDPDFRAEVRDEARELLRRLSHRPSVVCVCGNSEVEQQPAMMGLDPALGRHPFWEQELPAIVAECGLDAGVVRSTPCGGTLPFGPDGITHYFGVSGYMRGLDDVRRSDVRFAAECLAFANVPDHVEVPVHHPRWKQGVQRDAGSGWDIGAGWDFDDVRDHYLESVFGVDPMQLRRVDHARYLELSREVTGDVMASTMGEWRRGASRCRGALVLWSRDMVPGAGLGILDSRGEPKTCFFHLSRALAPVAVWMTDEGLRGVMIHLANDRPRPLPTTLRVGLYRDGAVSVAAASEPLVLAPHSTEARSLEGMIGRFLDSAWAYRFGPPVADVVVATLESEDPTRPFSQAFHFPGPRPVGPAPSVRLGGRARASEAGEIEVTLDSERFAYGVRIRGDGCEPQDDSFHLEPHRGRTVILRPRPGMAPPSSVSVTAHNVLEPARIPVGP